MRPAAPETRTRTQKLPAAIAEAHAAYEEAEEAAVVRKVFRRLMWFLFVVSAVSYLDRINISFAALSMNKTIGLTATTYGLATTIFYLGYMMCEVPSNVLHGQVRRATVAVAHHDHLGHRFGGHHVHLRFDLALCDAVRPGRRRSRFHARPAAVPDLLVPAPIPRARHGLFRHRARLRGGQRLGGLRIHPEDAALFRARELALAVPDRRAAGVVPGLVRPLLPGRQPAKSQVADRVRKGGPAARLRARRSGREFMRARGKARSGGRC